MPYTQEQKIQAVAVIRRFGGLTGDAIQAARDLLGAPGLSGSTLHDWQRKYGDLVDQAQIRHSESTPESSRIEKKITVEQAATIVEDANEALDQIFEQTARRYLIHANKPDTIASTKGKDAVVAAATAVDKMRLLRGLPTEIVQVLPTLVETIRRKGYDPAEAIKQMIGQFAALPDAPMVTNVHGAN